jgi:hypothetical protein
MACEYLGLKSVEGVTGLLQELVQHVCWRKMLVILVYSGPHRGTSESDGAFIEWTWKTT